MLTSHSRGGTEEHLWILFRTFLWSRDSSLKAIPIKMGLIGQDIRQYFQRQTTPEWVKRITETEDVDFLKKVIHEEAYPRQDYFESFQLSLVYLTGWAGDLPRFRAPGANHQARWMAKASYVLKITMFLQWLQLTRLKKHSLTTGPFCQILAWCSFPNFALEYLEFLTILQMFVDKEFRPMAEKALRRHLWYILKQGMVLMFFDERVSPAGWVATVKNLSRLATLRARTRLEKNFTLSDGLSETMTNRTLKSFGSLLRRWSLPRT